VAMEAQQDDTATSRAPARGDQKIQYEMIPRKYFSGGLQIASSPIHTTQNRSIAQFNGVGPRYKITVVNHPQTEFASSPAEAKEPFEKEGWVPNVVFPSGAVTEDDVTTLYYGAGDTVIVVKTFTTAGEIIDNKWGEGEYFAQAGLMPPDEMGLELAYNPAILKISDDFYLIVYRGVKKNVSNGNGLRPDNTTRFYAAFSKDGIHIDDDGWIHDPIMVPGTNRYEQNSIEDPRLVPGYMEDGKFFPTLDLKKMDTVAVFYVGFSIDLQHRQIHGEGETVWDKGRAIPLWATISVESVKKRNFSNWKRQGRVDIPVMVNGQETKDYADNKDMTIFPEPVWIEVEENGKKVKKWVIVVIDRPMGDRRHMDIRISWRDAQKGFDGQWNPDGEKILLKAELGTWKDTLGGGGTPVKTDFGWLFPYHATEYIDNGFEYVIKTLKKELKNLEGKPELLKLYE